MIDLPFLKGQKIAVLGLGKSGLATAAALAQAGAQPLLWDDQEAARADAARHGYIVVDFARDGFHGAQSLIQSPGIPHTLPRPHPVSAAAKAAGIPILIDIDLLYRAAESARFVGITGTNGKSTTTALIHHILEASGQKSVIGGNFGPPALSLPQLGAGGIYVLELSSYQLELTQSLTCDCAILLNLTPDHIDRHGDMAGYLAAKARIFRAGKRPQTFVIGCDDEWSAAEGRRQQNLGRRVIPISSRERLASGLSTDGKTLYENGERIFDLGQAPNLPGAHNGQNAIAALAACRSLGVEDAAIFQAMRTFPGLAHRQKQVATIKGVRFINDSKATNADAAAKALGCYDDIYWIAGGRPKEGGLAGLDDYMPRIREAFLIGEAAAEFGRWLAGRTKATQSGDLAIAVRQAAKAAFAGGAKNPVVLLSPACASWDQFANFEDRGNQFIKIVGEIEQETGLETR